MEFRLRKKQILNKAAKETKQIKKYNLNKNRIILKSFIYYYFYARRDWAWEYVGTSTLIEKKVTLIYYLQRVALARVTFICINHRVLTRWLTREPVFNCQPY